MKTALEELLLELHYVKVGNAAFRLNLPSAKIDHFLYLQFYGTRGELLAVHFGFRNLQVQSFAIQEGLKYGGDQYKSIKYKEKFDCASRFSLGRIAGWTHRWSLDLWSLSLDRLVECVRAAVVGELNPLVQKISGLPDLFEVLRSNQFPFEWFYSNALWRTAQVIRLGFLLGFEKDELIRDLLRHEKWIADYLRGAVPFAEFVQLVWSDASALDAPE
jgi:hypothetical protein